MPRTTPWRRNGPCRYVRHLPVTSTVVVGEYPASVDPVNSEILDRNAQQFASLRPAGGPLKVVRIGMPPRFSLVPGHAPWPTYTNVVYANGVLLLPVCPGLSKAATQKLELRPCQGSLSLTRALAARR